MLRSQVHPDFAGMGGRRGRRNEDVTPTLLNGQPVEVEMTASDTVSAWPTDEANWAGRRVRRFRTWGRVFRPGHLQSRSAKAYSELPEMTATLPCLPSTAKVIGPLTIWPPRLVFHRTVPVPRVERVEVAFTAAGEEQVGDRGQDAAVGHVVLVERPLALQRLWVEGNDGAVPRRIGPVVHRTVTADAVAGRSGNRRQHGVWPPPRKLRPGM